MDRHQAWAAVTAALDAGLPAPQAFTHYADARHGYLTFDAPADGRPWADLLGAKPFMDPIPTETGALLYVWLAPGWHLSATEPAPAEAGAR